MLKNIKALYNFLSHGARLRGKSHTFATTLQSDLGKVSYVVRQTTLRFRYYI